MGHSAAVWDYRAAIEITKDWNGIDQIVLRNPQGASARVSLHGAQVTSWRNEHGEELLFTSSKAIFKAPKAIRGGIPICFPQFGSCGSLELHGFARNRMWTIDDNPPPVPANDFEGKSFVDLLLKSSEEDMKCWPHSFEFRLRVSLSTEGDLSLISRVRNVNGKPFSFSFAYHTYLLVSDISEVRIEGLETLDYLDNLSRKERFTEQGDAITFESEDTKQTIGKGCDSQGLVPPFTSSIPNCVHIQLFSIYIHNHLGHPSLSKLCKMDASLSTLSALPCESFQ